MQAFISYADSIGQGSAMVLFSRTFDGRGAGLWRVFPAMLGGFHFGSLYGVMDDFGDLVAVEV